jgi:uncharacterized membrane protein
MNRRARTLTALGVAAIVVLEVRFGAPLIRTDFFDWTLLGIILVIFTVLMVLLIKEYPEHFRRPPRR